jgi:hypothetical protein
MIVHIKLKHLIYTVLKTLVGLDVVSDSYLEDQFLYNKTFIVVFHLFPLVLSILSNISLSELRA